jgi:hypothetical protein
VRTEQRRRRRPDSAWQRIESLHAVQAADVADGSVVIAVRFFAGVAQLAEPVRLSEQVAWILRASRGCGLDPHPGFVVDDLVQTRILSDVRIEDDPILVSLPDSVHFHVGIVVLTAV